MINYIYARKGESDMQKNDVGRNNAFLCVKNKNGINDFTSSLSPCVRVILLFEGKTKAWIENRSAELASAGDAIMLFPNQKCRLETQETEEYIYISADITYLSELLGVISSYTPETCIIKGAAKDSEICALAENIFNAYNDKTSDYRGTVLKGYITALLGRLFSASSLRKNQIEYTQRADTLSEIVSYCNSHFRENLSLAELERSLHISKYYISHIINERLGEGFNEYVNSIRINEACRLLIESDKSIGTISDEVGFGTVRSFNRAFKAKKGETAREYRKRNTEISKKD
jgi:YesN/AraC family two-component response regulator